MIKQRRAIAENYDRQLRGLFDDGRLQRRPVMPWASESVWLYTVASREREPIIRRLRYAGIDARAIWPALHTVPAYAQYANGEAFPVAEQVAREAFWLPMTFSPIEIVEIGGLIRDVLSSR